MTTPLSTTPSRRNKRQLLAASSAVRSVIEALELRTLLSTTLAPIADTFVRDHSYALANYGQAPVLDVKEASSGDDRRAYLKFDLTGVSTIPSAILELSGELENSSASPTLVGVYGVSDTTWIEGSGTTVDSAGDFSNTPAGEMTWNNQPGIDATPIATAQITTDSYQTYAFDVTSYLQAQLAAGATQVTLALEGIQPTADYVQFLSNQLASQPGAPNAGLAPQLVIGDSSSPAPTAAISAPDVTNASPSLTQQSVTVTYSGSAAINASTIASNNITVTPYVGGASLNVESTVGTTVNADGSVTAVYTVDAPGGGWTAANDGLYSVSVAAGAVADASGQSVLASAGSFRVAVGDSTPPTAAITAADVTTAGALSYTFSVNYSDNVAVDVSSIGLENVQVQGPSGQLNVTGLSTTPSADNSSIVATYTVAAPGGSWSAADNGAYTVIVNGSQVADTAGNYAASTSSQFNVNIAVPDTTPPTATISAPDIDSATSNAETVTVTFKDNVAVQASTISSSDLTVSGPNGALTANLTNVAGSGQVVTATYTIAAPGGQWNSSDNGAYTLTIPAGSVTDTSGNPIAATRGSFNVSAAVADTQPPTAAISAPAISTSGGANEKITVIYTDNVGVSTSSIGTGNLSVSGPNGPLTVTNFTFSGSGKTVTAVYTVDAPTGTWNAGDDGTYNIAINANQVKDTSGNPAAVTFGSFAVNIAIPNPSDATFNAGSAVTSAFVAEQTVTEPNGQILIAGYTVAGDGTDVGVVKCLNSDGTTDTSFGNQGEVLTPAGSDQWFSIVIQGENHFIVAGTDSGEFALARYDFNGNQDPTFGADGVELTSFGSSMDIAYAVTIAPNGQLVAAGMSNNRFALARYDANGNIDTTFGQGGRQLLDTGASTQALGAVEVLNGGQVVAAGASGSSIEVIQLTASGDIDPSFNGDGLMAIPGLEADTSAGAAIYTVGLAIQSDGKIVVANRTTDGHMGIARINDNGTLDTTFGTNGIAEANFGGDDEADSVVIESNGAIIGVGTSLQNGVPYEAIAAFDSSGQLITSFGENGLSTFSTDTSSTGRELHIGDLFLRAFGAETSGGKLLVGASAVGGATVTSSLRRIIVPGTASAPGIAETLIGVFGFVNNKHTKLVIKDLGATFTLSSGEATALQSGNNIHIEITGAEAGTLIMNVTGGGTVGFTSIDITGGIRTIRMPAATIAGGITGATLGAGTFGDVQGNVTITGSIASFTASSLEGTMQVGGAVGRLALGTLTGNVNVTGNIGYVAIATDNGTIYSGGTIGHGQFGSVSSVIDAANQIVSLTAATLANATILAGVNLGSDGLLGGTGTAADSYAAGTIGTIRITSSITSSVMAAGANPVNGTFGDGNDTAAGAGVIKNIFAKSADSASRFEASTFGVAHLPKKVVVTTDPRFITL